MSKTYKGKVMWNGNHYFKNDEVIGSKIKYKGDGTLWLYDDEDNYIRGFGDFTRYEWVEIDKNSLEVKENE